MPYPESVLATDEKVVERFHPHWVTLIPATIWFLVICAAAGAGIAVAPDEGTGRTVMLIAVLVVALGLLSILSIAPWVRWRTSHYIFTTHRVLIRRGVFTHSGRDIALQRITDVAFRQTLWDRIVGAGTLIIESAGEQGQEVLHDIPRSDRQQQLLNRLIEEDHDRRARMAHGGAGSPPQGYPPQGYQQGGYPQQHGYPPQGYPGQGHQPGYPQQPGPPGGPPYPPTQAYPRPE
ncbi:MAG TPA: PH domain-containing protein [Jatrophihabitans sp.]|nr:PH domain-containing protein [Jatrophihabitans sp.]